MVLLAVCAAVLWLLRGTVGRFRFPGPLAFLLLGFLWAGWQAGERLEAELPLASEGEDQVVVGHLCDLPSPGSFNSVRFSLCVQQWEEGNALAQHGPLPGRLRLAWYGDDAHLDLPSLIRVKVRLKRPHGSVNPAGFRYESWLFRNDYRATGTVRELSAWPGGVCGLSCSFHQWRRQLSERLSARLGSMEHFSLAEALLLGQRGRMTPEHWRTLEATGTIHLVAISGLHIGLVALGLGVLLRTLLAWLPQHRLGPSRRRLIVLVIVVSGSLTYAMAAGFTVPTRRAWLMVAMGSWLVFRAGRVAPGTGWLLALGLVILIDPFAPLDRGFWLSFGAVAVLLLVFSGRLGPPGKVATLFLAQSAVFAGLWPMLAFMDEAPATAGWLANLVAIPWLSLVVMPVLVAGALLLMMLPGSGLDNLMGGLFDAVLGTLWWYLSVLADLPAPAVQGGPIAAAMVAALVLLVIIVPASPVRWIAGAMMALWLLSAPEGLAPGERANASVARPEIWIFDVGQGLSVMMRHRNQVLLYDTGPEAPSGYSAVESVLVPSLRKLGVARIDSLVVSHGDSDHAGGLPALFDAFEVGRVISGEPARVAERLPEQTGVDIHPCIPGHLIALGDVTLELWQDGHDQSASGVMPVVEGNDASCVAVARFGNTAIILPGDISSSVERRFPLGELLAGQGFRFLVASHHGSKTSSDPAWVSALQPDAVVYTAGYRHRYGHPHADVVQRFDSVGAQAWNTAWSGALRGVIADRGIHITEWRSGAPFWIRPAEAWWRTP
ncbi:DNA internalization-related competence protein ComEC/Rec2 [Marinobacter sp.]|uniref:DNA internalization-related competence protein ComEC/Rec2 n=1 Tax=Marinobacter sp. TaxID=50741 RepID=UPI00384BCD05